MSERVQKEALLRRFEPIIRYTRGEEFFPMDVEPYLERCSLWQQFPGGEPRCLVPEGELTPETLAEPRLAGFGAIHFLKFITPLNLAELAAYRLQNLQEGLKRRDGREQFRAGRGRLARVGYSSRFVDALFQLSLLARGRVPGDTAAAAALEYRRIMADEAHYRYYGRVVRQNGWIVLQYWFFYPFNNWRSGFFGANDHEGDWEMVTVYLSESEADGSVRPEWVAYASHDFEGDDLRRRWDDPELETVGEHPVIYAGAGSHANYYRPGEYLAELELPFLAPLVQAGDRLELFLRRTLHRYRAADGEGPDEEADASFNLFRIPFVDYARGDGVAIGPGQERQWGRPGLLSPAPDWARYYRGLWGLYARDPFSGENAPAGPRYNRDGTVRRSWYDPLGWAGLDKVPPPDEALRHVLARRAEVDVRRQELEEAIEEKSEALVELGIEARAMRGRPHLQRPFAERQQQIDALAEELDGLRAELTENESLLRALDLYAGRLRAGLRGPLRAHITRPHRPASDVSLRFARFAEVWAAVSISVGLITFVLLFLFAPEYLLYGLALLVAVFFFVEAGFRRQLPALITGLTVTLSVIASLVLLYEFFWEIVVAAVVTAGAYLMWGNLRELWA
ncbi:MAG: hypothetical protein R3248_09345 [Candidatus Promineifilaceae bacterium]|nr:hypothetical protein [Candidatus Promineifilaceae bacterium]